MVLKYAHLSVRMESVMPTIQTKAVKTSPRARQLVKRAANLSLSADALDDAKLLQINVSQVCDAHLREVVRREKESRWRSDHADFIAAYNASFETEGLPLDAWKTF
jgi:antitoxin CcdA